MVDTGWENSTIDFETYGTNKQEMEYVSPEEVPKESIEKIKKIKQRGSMVSLVFSRENKNKLVA